MSYQLVIVFVAIEIIRSHRVLKRLLITLLCILNISFNLNSHADYMGDLGGGSSRPGPRPPRDDNDQWVKEQMRQQRERERREAEREAQREREKEEEKRRQEEYERDRPRREEEARKAAQQQREKEHGQYIESVKPVYEKYNLQSNKNLRLGDVANKLEKLHNRRPTTTHDTSKVEHLIRKADQEYVRHEHVTGNAFASFASNYLEYKTDKAPNPTEFKNFNNEPLTSKDLNYSRQAYDYLYIDNIPTTFNNVYDLEYAVASNYVAKLIDERHPNDQHMHFHASMALYKLEMARENQDFKWTEVALENVANLGRFSLGVTDGLAHTIYDTVHAVTHPYDTSLAIYNTLLYTPLHTAIIEQVKQTWREWPDYTLEQRGELLGRTVGSLIGSKWLPGGAAKTLSNPAIRAKVVEAAGELYYQSAYKEMKLLDHGPWTTTGGPLGNYRPYLNEGPISETFRNSHYIEHIESTEWNDFYRLCGGRAHPFRHFWSREIPTRKSVTMSRAAIDPDWGNTAEKVVKISVPPKNRFFEGPAAPTKLSKVPDYIPESELIRHGDDVYLRGGGNQIYFHPEDYTPEQLEKWKTGEWDL